MLLRQRPDGFYAKPEHRGWFRVLLWRLGFDYLTVYERLAQVRREAADWKRWLNESEGRARSALNELGVPGDGYPTPVANAVSILHGDRPADNPSGDA